MSGAIHGKFRAYDPKQKSKLLEDISEILGERIEDEIQSKLWTTWSEKKNKFEEEMRGMINKAAKEAAEYAINNVREILFGETGKDNL